jgi:6,7-dimethyl-8-ribityllumazine synthase
MKKILIVNSNYYPLISKKILLSAKIELKKFRVKTINAPGIFEIPFLISKNIGKFDAFLALGCVIKGETPHFDFISASVTNALMELTVKYKKPIGNGVLTCLNSKQAEKRVKKGAEAANAVKQVLTNEIY